MQRALPAEPDSAAVRRVATPIISRCELASEPPWQLVERVGRGGESEVWRAVDSKGRSIAAKISRSAHHSAARLRREHSRLVTLQHRHIVATHGFVALAEGEALALEYLPGGDLVPLLGAHPRHWIGAARDVSAALAHVHALGFVHRDVKARNVLFGDDGRARLIDFAAAVPRGASGGAGGTTAAHRSGWQGATAEYRDDVYAFAVLLYELLAGRLPYGVAGAGPSEPRRAPAWPLGAEADGPSRRLAERVLAVLTAPEAPAATVATAASRLSAAAVTTATVQTHAAGLSAFADVLESAAAA